jgi:ABC-2 type transport system ATP-binding protein
VVRQADDVRGCISLTGQYAAVDEALTGRENLKLIGQLRRLPDVNRRADELLKIFDLEDAAKRQAAAYSGGMRRRLDIAMSLMGTPQVIFLDEPTTGLDPQSRIAMWDMVKSLADGGATVFLTTQYLEEAEYLADHVAILHGGVIIAEGSLEELRKLFPPAKVEYIEKQPTLEEIFLKIIGGTSEENAEQSPAPDEKEAE